MGTGSVLFEIVKNKGFVGAKFHLLFENAWKPPVDIAINRESLQIEYISCFAQNEKIIESKLKNEISLIHIPVSIEDLNFEEKYEKSVYKEFDNLKVNNDIILLSKCTREKIYAYQLNTSNYILCNRNNEILGVLMKDIQSAEYEILKESDII